MNPDQAHKMLGMICIQTVWHSDGISKREWSIVIKVGNRPVNMHIDQTSVITGLNFY